MDELEYARFYEKTGKVNGWDFSQLQVSVNGTGWQFNDEVIKRCNKTKILLDIGTGGGENLLALAPTVLLAVGIDSSNGMIDSAKENLKKMKLANLRFVKMDSENLFFPPDFFDVVTSRHAPFDSNEVARVLKSGGVFLTQQVSEDDKLNIKNTFGRGQSFGDADGALKRKYMKELKAAGFSVVQAFDYDAKEYYQRPEDLLFLLQHTPIIPDFGKKMKDLRLFDEFIKNNQTAKGICTNAKRFLLIATK
ncbi:class I SAM-dependent methyltransferase [Planococcus sp. 4-30]|uniref:class I SAM-dependent methyltransferase n=1 Tax=Planococcus TaxID=1372 RepID=UPI001CBEF85C|nr:class I SAM-dependent methyltransferase [Planococcus sp. 4-30]